MSEIAMLTSMLERGKKLGFSFNLTRAGGGDASYFARFIQAGPERIKPRLQTEGAGYDLLPAVRRALDSLEKLVVSYPGYREVPEKAFHDEMQARKASRG